MLSGAVAFMVAAVPVQQSALAAHSLVFDGVTVVDVEHGKLVPAQRVVIIGNRIQAVGAARGVKVPAGAQVVAARGRYLIPGLWDMHVHPERHATDLFYPLFLANGLTGMRDAGSRVPLDTVLLWRREILAGHRVGPPRQILSGQSIAGPKADCERKRTDTLPQTCVTDAADARHYIDSIVAAGADMIKPRAVKRALYFAIAAEARRRGVPFGGHAEGVTAFEASDSGAKIIEHPQILIGADGMFMRCWGSRASATIERCQPVAERFRRNGTWWAPTLTAYSGGASVYGRTEDTHARRVYTHLTKRAGEFWAGALLSGNWLRDLSLADSPQALRPDSLGYLRIAQRVDLPILAGTDIMEEKMLLQLPGFALHAELAMYVAEGLTPLQALQSATLSPATLLHATDSLGTVAPGKLADLVLLDADPLADITNTTTIRAVVANGRYYDRAALDGVLTGVQAKAKELPPPPPLAPEWWQRGIP